MSDSTSTVQGISLPSTLEEARIASIPPSAYYIPNFLSEQEETAIINKVASAPKPRWKQLAHRRLQAWPTDLVRDALLDAPLPRWLVEPVVPRLLSIPRSASASAAVFEFSPHQRPNHVLVNEYPPGVGIMPHKDGPAYHPVVCTISLGGSLCLNLYRNQPDGALDPQPAWRILQEPRSLLITTDDLYSDYLHGIDDLVEDTSLCADTVANWDLLRSPVTYTDGRNQRQLRTSLTYRDVLKVSMAASKIASKLGPGRSS